MTLLIFFPRDLESEAGYNRTTSSRTSSFGGNGAMTMNPQEKFDSAPIRPHRPGSAADYEASAHSWDPQRPYSNYSGQLSPVVGSHAVGPNGTPTSATCCSRSFNVWSDRSASSFDIP